MVIADALSRQHISERDYMLAKNLARESGLKYVKVRHAHADFESFY